MLFLLFATACRSKKKWFNYDCSWKCDEYNFRIEKHGGSAVLNYNDIEHSLKAYKSNNARDIGFYYSSSNEGVSEDMIVMKANTTFKNDILYLEFTKDDVADFLGKTLTFTKVKE